MKWLRKILCSTGIAHRLDVGEITYCCNMFAVEKYICIDCGAVIYRRMGQ